MWTQKAEPNCANSVDEIILDSCVPEDRPIVDHSEGDDFKITKASNSAEAVS